MNHIYCNKSAIDLYMSHSSKKNQIRVYSTYCLDALRLLGSIIRETRIKNHYSQQEISDRAGISRALLQRIEKGNPKCEVGVVFEVATILGVKLFSMDESELQEKLDIQTQKLLLIPQKSRKPKISYNDDF